MNSRFVSLLSVLLVAIASCPLAEASPGSGQGAVDLGSTFPSLTNGMGDDLQMYELYAAYWLTSQDAAGVKAMTWKLKRPLGIPFGPSLTSDREVYPGRVWEYGVGVFYQRFLWKGLFASFEVTPLKKVFLDENDKKVEEGFRLYTSYHLGYRVSFFKDRVFLEPRIHCNYWPIDDKGPEGFAKKDERWNNYFLFEPNFYFGVSF
jgi:hypothetical protein